MLRFLSNYLFQNENQPENDDPTTISSSEKQGPSHDVDLKKEGGGGSNTTCRKEEFMDFMEGEKDRESDEEEDDWVLIGEGEKETKPKDKGQEGEIVQEQPVSLVAAPSEEEDKVDGGCEKEGDDDNEEEDDEEDEEQGRNLLYENMLIEHPSMSVYVDLATSINSNGLDSCVSLSSIAPEIRSPGESVIVISGHEDEDSEESSDEDMDILEVVHPEVKATITTPQYTPSPPQEDSASDMENNNNFMKSKTLPANTSSSSSSSSSSIPLQNGRRKKGHFPITSSNSTQMPRRHLRSSGGNTRNNNNNQTFQMISSNTWTSSTSGQSPDAMHDSMKRKRASNNNNNNSSTTASGNGTACGIAMVGAGSPNPAPNSMINKNLKLVEMFPTASASSKRRQRNPPPQKGCTHPKGHFLQESRRRQDLQNCNRKSFVNNDRRSHFSRVQKGAAASAGGARSK